MANYCKAEELQARLWPDEVQPSGPDVLVLKQVIAEVSGWIDQYTARRFYSTVNDETRYFTATRTKVLELPDLHAITSIKTDEDGDRVYEYTWSATDYDKYPYNAALDSEPWTEIRVAPNGSYGFPAGVAKGVEIIGKYGYNATGSHPAGVKGACLLQCERLYMRKDAIFGIAGAGELGEVRLIPKLDVDVQELLQRFKREV